MKQPHLHFMGIGGQGISAVAQMALVGGNHVTGCDQRESATVKALRQAGIAIQIGHSSEHLEGVDSLIISPAVPALDPHNPEVLAARERGIQVLTWQELLGTLMRDKCVLSVSGVHGKGTTTSMLSLMLVDAQLDPTCVIGAVVPRFGANYRLGESPYFVNEADEFNHNFWHYHPRLIVVTSIEFEHPEFFADYEAFLAAFEHFIRGMDFTSDWPLPPTLILNAGSAGCLDLQARLHDWPGRILTYALEGHSVFGEPATFEATDIRLDGETSFRVKSQTGANFPEELTIQLQVPGAYNIENALAALTAAHCIGIAAETIVQALESFGGTRRRFEIRQQGPLQIDGKVLDVMLVDDYAHHPTAIAATLNATRRRYPGQRLIAVYQPHMYSRTKTFLNQFLEAFDEADLVFIADIFPARERDTGLIHARDLVQALAQRPHFTQGDAQILHSGSVEETTRLLRQNLRSGDLAVIMGAGDIYTVTELLLHDTKQA
ncbi:UDP-N-acetylmuramate--L-alanine ligase [Tengunoibacter tsumagoiensis]|uniref:UDP-N-acetylmuramate--L-alanine ligase n=1 Tax=Tengunoibacter tsumagoiensis TaxID=2014871 RepID=A0A402A5L3_9CHLR|nr:UDP-N-acetylmuramate--L-alanine ligase [Tengunoibacter tsumagoiensis]GCE14402.1 UDP-N-acetylmuramate--L-alanine ligase [Tengunoibacter tsumagoiensis]